MPQAPKGRGRLAVRDQPIDPGPRLGASSKHSAVNETLCRVCEAFLKQSHLTFCGVYRLGSSKMRSFAFGVVLIAVAAVGFHILISSSLAAARDAKPASFSERFDPVLKSQ